MMPRVLAVDDNEVNLAVIREMLEGEFEVTCVTSGEEALSVAPVFSPDIVLLDVMMPGIDGFETCQRLRQLSDLGHTKILMLSARADVQDRLSGYEAGADDYVTKPFNEREVLAKVKALSRMTTATQVESIWHTVESTRNLASDVLVNLTRLRDTETGGHLRRMQRYSRLLAERLAEYGLVDVVIDERFLADLDRASMLHDVGKVGIPDRILKKPGQLTDDEIEIMKRHTILGAEIIERAIEKEAHGGFLKMAAEVALSHHERFDGGGYPDGLTGTNIPLAARIVTLADSFDAITSRRVYKEAESPNTARRLICNETGRQFDPNVVRAFLASYDDFVRVHSVELDCEDVAGTDLPPAAAMQI